MVSLFDPRLCMNFMLTQRAGQPRVRRLHTRAPLRPPPRCPTKSHTHSCKSSLLPLKVSTCVCVHVCVRVSVCDSESVPVSELKGDEQQPCVLNLTLFCLLFETRVITSV